MKIHLTPSQIGVAADAIGQMAAVGEFASLPTIQGGSSLMLPGDRPTIAAFVALLDIMPQRYEADDSLRERQRWGKVYACQNLKERVSEGLALSGDETPIAAGALSIPAGNLLRKIGVNSVERLAMFSEGELRGVRGFADGRIAEVNRLLARHGKTLRPDPEAVRQIRR